ncbi:MAG: TraR/DksA family transcriptional regulator [Planctomycetaceae bacterium]
MKKQKLEQTRMKLLDMRDRLQSEIRTGANMLNEQIQAPGDVTDLPTHNADHDAEGLDAELATEAVQQQTLDAVEAALDRLDDGSYGVCKSCGEPIGDERLDALPYTALCIDCERQRESE